MADLIDKYDLHKAVFQNDLKTLSRLLRKHDVAEKDKHGNTALHLAVMLGRKECVQLLLKYDAPVKVKNGLGWTVLAEAVSYGNRPTISSLVRKFRQQSREQMESRRPNLVKALNQIGDFYMELKWDFQSWVPLVSRILPSDICKIYKCGANIRLDTTLVDFSDMRWERGDISFIFNGNATPNDSLTVLDNVLKVYQNVKYEESEIEIEDEVDLLMSTDILSAQISTKNIHFIRAQSGWIFREDKKVCVYPPPKVTMSNYRYKNFQRGNNQDFVRQSANANYYEAVNTLKAITLTITTRSMGFGTANIFRTLFELHVAAVPMRGTIYQMYRMSLSMIQTKVIIAQRGVNLICENFEDYYDFPTVRDFVIRTKAIVNVPDQITRPLNQIGVLKVNEKTYVPKIARVNQTENNLFLPQSEQVTLSNLRRTVESLANPEVPLVVRQQFYQNNPIPGCVWQGAPDNPILLNADEIMPAQYGVEAFTDDLYDMRANLSYLSKKGPKYFTKPVDYHANGTKSMFVCNMQNCLRVIDRNPGEELNAYYIRLRLTGDIEHFYNIERLNATEQLHGNISLLGEVPALKNLLYPVYLIRDNREIVAGQYESELYAVHGLLLESRKRREHLSHDDLQKNKALIESFTRGSNNQHFDQHGVPVRRTSLSPPPDKNVTWQEYIAADINNYPRLGRELVYKECTKSFKATIAMSCDFPLSVEMLLNVLEVIAPFKHFAKLRDFITFKLPNGFPVKVEIPILPTITAKVTFQQFEFRSNMTNELFTTPRDYTEDPTRFPDL